MGSADALYAGRAAYICNNAAERAIRPLAIGRKNWLFAGSDPGGQRAAIIYTLTETAKMNGIDPEAYLRAVIARIADHPAKRIGELRPGTLHCNRQIRGHHRTLTYEPTLGSLLPDTP